MFILSKRRICRENVINTSNDKAAKETDDDMEEYVASPKKWFLSLYGPKVIVSWLKNPLDRAVLKNEPFFL